MPGAFRASRALYRSLLILYPRELRHRFGAEMTEVFGQQVMAAWGQGGLSLVLQVWGLALWELASVALPMQVCSTTVAVPVLSAAGALALFQLVLWGIGTHCHR